MEEITIRFEIVRLAVKMADHDTVSVQAKKLRDLSLDEDLNEIIALLESRNYRQALFLMKGYISSLEDSFFSSAPSEPVARKPQEQESKQESQNLFDMMQPQANTTINLDDMLRMTEESVEDTVEYNEPVLASENYVAQAKEEVYKNEAYLDVNKNRAENKEVKPFDETEVESLVDIDGEIVSETGAQQHIDREEEISAQQEIDIVETGVGESTTKESEEEPHVENIDSYDYNIDNTAEELLLEEPEVVKYFDNQVAVETTVDSVDIDIVRNTDNIQDTGEENNEETALEIKRKADYDKNNRLYPPISYIDQKFRNMRHQFPQVEQAEDGIIDEVKVLLKQMAGKGYTENDIKDAIMLFKDKKEEGNIAEAAQVLLLSAASESKYAQLLLARELFKGEVLKVDYPEAFTQINRLAEHDYPEAICDLAQLYEYGYGIKKDKKTAQLLYEEAAEMGVERAKKHAERFSGKKGILSSFFQ
ncbi:MAG: sel1 repeat family protein [Sulfurovum sp.]|nr:sel1 repeat family protein [Sulfurovum sp.]